VELRVFSSGQYHARFMLTPAAGSRPSLQARLVALTLQLHVAYGPDQGRQHAAALDPGRFGELFFWAHPWPGMPGLAMGTTGRSSTLPRQAAGICAAPKVP
jgi:hypothetical protein